MSDQTPAQRFADALQQFESSGDGDALREQFSDSPELLRPEVDKTGSSSSDTAAFWDAYLEQFDEIRTEFTHVVESDQHAALEWTSTGRLSTGRDIEYRGVSLLSMSGDGRVERFATYYDTAAFLEPAES